MSSAAESRGCEREESGDGGDTKAQAAPAMGRPAEKHRERGCGII